MAVRDKFKNKENIVEETEQVQDVNESPENIDDSTNENSDFRYVKNDAGEFVLESTEELSTRESIRRNAAKIQESSPKQEKFIWIRAWVSYIVSLYMKDRGKIPDNIGDRILITNNLCITKAYMTSYIQIQTYGSNTPITMLGVLNNELRERGNKAVLDLTMKNTPYDFDPKKNGLSTRIRMWENNLDSNTVTKAIKEKSARCLYTVEVAQQRPLKHSRIFLSVRAKDIQTLNSAEKTIYETLKRMGCTYTPCHSNIKNVLEYISILGNKCQDLKSFTPVMMSNVTISQTIPNCGSFNDKSGYYIGQNIMNGSPYYIDFSTITSARNMYVVAPSGVGKTVLALNMAQSAYEHGSACCFMDIKGNEYNNFVNATNGCIISLRATATDYINSWIMRKEDVTDGGYEMYFKSRIQFSKQQIIILSGITNREQLLELEELLDEFHDSLYVSIGVSASNVNSWSYTLSLNPYEVFRRLENYLTPQKKAKYTLPKSFMGTLRMYMSESGTKSYIFKNEFDYARILNSNTISFDFGILANTTTSDVDLDLFRLKFLYMSKLNSEFTTRKYAEGKRTFKILEESQIVSPEINQMYVLEYTLRRSQNQDTILLGNSIQALKDREAARPLIENTRGLFIGQLDGDSRRTVIEQFSLQHLEHYIKIPGSEPKYKNSFVFVNKMQYRELYPIIQVQIPIDESTGKPKSYKINTPVKEGNVMSNITI